MSNKDNQFIWKENDVTPITNKDLVCSKCKHCIIDNIFECRIYTEQKPGEVLYGGKCDYFSG